MKVYKTIGISIPIEKEVYIWYGLRCLVLIGYDFRRIWATVNNLSESKGTLQSLTICRAKV